MSENDQPPVQQQQSSSAGQPFGPQQFNAGYQPQQPVTPPARPYTDVLGILSIVFAFLFSPVGIVLGIVGIVQAKKHGVSRALSIVGTVLSTIFTLLTVLFFVMIFGLATSSLQQRSRDVERENDISVISAELDVYYVSSGQYPTLDQINDSVWRSTNLSNVDDETFRDPLGNSSVLVSVPKKAAYAYVATPFGCNNASLPCKGFELTATLDSGTTYTQRPNPSNEVNPRMRSVYESPETGESDLNTLTQ